MSGRIKRSWRAYGFVKNIDIVVKIKIHYVMCCFWSPSATYEAFILQRNNDDGLMEGSVSHESESIPYEAELLAVLDAVRKFERDFKFKQGFNVFEALGIAKQEIRHSRFLAYLLDPRESHGFGDRFLRKVLMVASDGHPRQSVGRLLLSIRDLSDATVECERDHFDISVQIRSLGLLFVIENKIDSLESHEQLQRYRMNAQNKYPDYRFMGCFLTREGYAGDDEHWGVLSYAEIAEAIRGVLEESSSSEGVQVVLSHYIDFIERKIVTSQALIDACRELYREHKVAFDQVFEHGQQSFFGLAFQEFISNNPSLVDTVVRSDTAYFLERSWQEDPVTKVADRKRWPSVFPVIFWFKVGERKLHLRLEIGPIVPPYFASREFLVESFRKAYRTGGAKVSNTFTRILTISTDIPEVDPSMEEILEAMNKLWGKVNADHGGVKAVSDLVEEWKKKLYIYQT